LECHSKGCQTTLDGRIPDDPPNGGGITEGQIEELTNIWSKLSFDESENRMSQLDDHNSSPSYLNYSFVFS
jgi:hypothetical protein